MLILFLSSGLLHSRTTHYLKICPKFSKSEITLGAQIALSSWRSKTPMACAVDNNPINPIILCSNQSQYNVYCCWTSQIAS